MKLIGTIMTVAISIFILIILSAWFISPLYITKDYVSPLKYTAPYMVKTAGFWGHKYYTMNYTVDKYFVTLNTWSGASLNFSDAGNGILLLPLNNISAIGSNPDFNGVAK